ncbi:MAG: hypothetical protein BV457_05995, partial [Thermoplasmata archaeon M9B1D]
MGIKWQLKANKSIATHIILRERRIQMGRPAKIEIERPVEIKDGKPKRGRKKKSPYDLNTRDIARTIYKLDINT